MLAPFMINPESGQIRFFDLRLKLTPRMPESEFLAATSSLHRENLGSNGPWQRYSIRELISGDRLIGVFLVFLERRLNMLTFAYGPKDERWEDLSEASELAREKEYQQELATQLGGKDTFAWGVVGANLDRKSGGTEIWMRFSDQPVQD